MTTNNQQLLDQIEGRDIQALTMCAVVGQTEVDFDHIAIVEAGEKMVAMVIMFSEVGESITYRLVIKLLDIETQSVIKACELYTKGVGEEYDPADLSLEIFNYIIKRGFPWSPTPTSPISDYLIGVLY